MHRIFAFIITLLITLPCSSASATTTTLSQAINQKNTENYWTPERMRDAKEFPLPLANFNVVKPMFAPEQKKDEIDFGDGMPPQYKIEPKMQLLFNSKLINVPHFFRLLDRGTLNEHFSSSRLIPVSADLTYPYSAVGKLYFTIPGRGNYVCSASVIKHRIIVTAGHCVHKGSGGSGGFYTNWLFIPAYRDGTAPYKTWKGTYAVVSDTWATGNSQVPNAADYAFIELADNSFNGELRKIGSITGYLGYQTLSLIPNHAHMLGYPCNLDRCAKMHQVTAQSARSVAPNNAEYGSDMGGGSSGGPWVQNFGALADEQTGGLNPGLNRVIGVTSYGYIDKAPKAQGSSIPDSRFTNLLNSICAHQAGNCTT